MLERLSFIEVAKQLDLSLPEIAELLLVVEGGTCTQVRDALHRATAASGTEASADPAAPVDPLNRAQERVVAARLERDRAPSLRSLGRAEAEAMVDYLGDVGAALKRATPEELAELYASLSLELTYHPDDRLVDVAIEPRRGSERVRGGSCALTTRVALQ